MNKEFIPYEESLALKELGFDEECFYYYNNSKKLMEFEYYDLERANSTLQSDYGGKDKICTAPLYQQAFRWFREKHNLLHSMDWFKGITFTIYDLTKPVSNKTMLHIVSADTPPNETYEEAELACLRELIKIVKQKE